jgi:LysR family transcriptional regulator, regulator for bpeEF and oprC
MDLSALSSFVAVADRRSFTAAAAALGITASGISKAVGRLEDELGVRLFNRSTRSLSLTSDGAAFYDRCRQILNDVEDAKLAMLRAQSDPSGRLRVSMPAMFGKLRVIPAIASFLTRYPMVKVEASLTDRFVDVVEEGFDVVIRMGESPDTSLIARPLGTAQFLAAASPKYLLEFSKPKHPRDLVSHACISYASPMTRKLLDWTFIADDKLYKHIPLGSFSVDNGEAVVDAAVNNMGVIYCHNYMIQRELAAGTLIQVLEEFTPTPDPVSIMYPQSRHLSPRVRAFVDYLAAHFE